MVSLLTVTPNEASGVNRQEISWLAELQLLFEEDEDKNSLRNV
jgi:hypothetical protein